MRAADAIKPCCPAVLPAAVSNLTALPGRDKRFAFFPPRTPPFFGARGEQTFMVVSPLNYSACVQAVAQPSLAAYCSALLHLRKIFFAHPAAVVCRFVPRRLRARGRPARTRGEQTFMVVSPLNSLHSRHSSYRWMQRESRSRFATSTVRECTIVHDRTGTGARRKIDHDAPPPLVYPQKLS